LEFLSFMAFGEIVGNLGATDFERKGCYSSGGISWASKNRCALRACSANESLAETIDSSGSVEEVALEFCSGGGVDFGIDFTIKLPAVRPILSSARYCLSGGAAMSLV